MLKQRTQSQNDIGRIFSLYIFTTENKFGEISTFCDFLVDRLDQASLEIGYDVEDQNAAGVEMVDVFTTTSFK